ncbi:hypothetical protein ABCS02_25040 [Microbacterium sp. X-17]|uniref:DUF7010 family protein n=1 Tax=Microbacterium sp. X-17 TaxID=3144404 RepID=UPI0031F57505
MDVRQAQAEVRDLYRGGFTGPLVAAFVWFAATAAYQWASPGAAMAVLFLGGILIFPLSTLLLKLMGGPAALPKGHPSISLAMQSAFTVPLGLLVAIALGTFDPTLFLPASLIIVGAHYLTFISLYGMRAYGALAGVLVALGAASLFWIPALRELSGCIGGAILLLSAIPLYLIYRTSSMRVPG